MCALENADGTTGPAHAVYFATYEAVKHAMGGNMGNEHHPLAAGRDSPSTTFGLPGSGSPIHSNERGMRNHCQ